MSTPLPWITDRLPTRADGDKDGDVVLLLDGDNNGWCGVHWLLVKRGQPWLAFTPPTTASTPAPLTRPRRIISITRTMHGATETIDAVADDGTAWWKVPGDVDWTQLPALPKSDG